MGSTLTEPRDGRAPDDRDDPAALIRRLLASAPRGRRERRRQRRTPFPYPIHLTPVERDGRTPAGAGFSVLGKQLSEGGLDFYHREPIPHRRVIASIPLDPEGWIGLLLELHWCRFGRHGWYENGGRFLRAVESPIAGTASAA